MSDKPQQLPLFLSSDISEAVQSGVNLDDDGFTNKLDNKNRAFHDWYRFVLSFPPRLVDHYIKEFGIRESDVLLDPFCGTGTTLVEAKLQGITSIGLEANPFAQFATSVKVDWRINPEFLVSTAEQIGRESLKLLEAQGIDDRFLSPPKIPEQDLRKLDEERMRLLLKNSMSPLPLHKVLVLRDFINQHEEDDFFPHMNLALANAAVYSISNLRFGPEVGIGKQKKDIRVVFNWISEVRKIAKDLRKVCGQKFPEAEVHLADAREIEEIIPPKSVNAVITSPPYPNEKDYSRTTRLELVLLGFVNSMQELREVKKTFVRSNTRGVYKADEDDKWVKSYPEIERVAQQIEQRRIELGKTSGFEKMYSRVTRLYFGGMARHLSELRSVLRPGAYLAYVVGDQASYLRVMIRTGKLLAGISEALGYEVVRIDLFRNRFATATKQDLREEVVILRWKG